MSTSFRSRSIRGFALKLTLCLAAGAFVPGVFAADLPKPEPTPGRIMLPQEHQYQRQLRAYMATLTEKDFAHGVEGLMGVAPTTNPDLEYQYRNYLLTTMPGGGPLVGSKRGVPSINNPPKLFLLSSIEGEKAIMKPLVYPEALMQNVLWDYPGNIYFNNRGLKMRCFINSTLALVMLDDFLDKTPLANRADWRAYQLIIIGSPYAGFKDLLPPEVQKAYQDGVKKLARRVISWGVRGEEPNLDYGVPVGLWYASKICNDPAFTKECEDYARMMFADPRYFHPAGFWLDRGGLDTGFGGHANFYAVWTALASDWPFAKEAIERVYRLRAHLTLPEPDGTSTGPAAFNTRLCSTAQADQWDFAGRDRAALMITDEAAVWAKPLPPEALADAAKSRSAEVARQIHENPVKSGNGSAETPYVYFPNEEIPATPWRALMVENWNFPASMVFAYDFYKKGAYAHLAELEAKKSPMLKLPFDRNEMFVRNFAKAFFAAKMSNYGVVLHTGPVGRQVAGNGLVQLPTALGFGGGQISAFWTPTTGSVILGRRGGMIHQVPYDKQEEWRTWPIHAVTGATAEGRIFTSARIVSPEVEVADKAGSAAAKDAKPITVSARGVIPAMKIVPDPNSTAAKPIVNFYDEPLAGKVDYTRTFDIDNDKLRVKTVVKSSGEDKIAELYETIPVYLRDMKYQPTATPTTIEFQINGQWAAATLEFQANVTAIRLTRFTGAVEITFDKPQRVGLSAAEWKDTVLLAWGNCRNVLIDLMPAKPGEFKEATVGYTIAAVKK